MQTLYRRLALFTQMFAVAFHKFNKLQNVLHAGLDYLANHIYDSHQSKTKIQFLTY